MYLLQMEDWNGSVPRDKKPNDGHEQGNIFPLNEYRRTHDEYEQSNTDFQPSSALKKEEIEFPIEQKKYFQAVFRAYKKQHDIGDQKLRDLIMQEEDNYLKKDLQNRGIKYKKDDYRDKRLTKDDLRKWLEEYSSHQLGNEKCLYVDRFFYQTLSAEDRIAVQQVVRAQRRRFHISAFKDLFSNNDTKGFQEYLYLMNGSVFLGKLEPNHKFPFISERSYFVLQFECFESGVGYLNAVFIEKDLKSESLHENSELDNDLITLDIELSEVKSTANGFFFAREFYGSAQFSHSMNSNNSGPVSLDADAILFTNRDKSSYRDIEDKDQYTIYSDLFARIALSKVTLYADDIVGLDSIIRRRLSNNVITYGWSRLSFSTFGALKSVNMALVKPSHNTLRVLKNIALGYDYG